MKLRPMKKSLRKQTALLMISLLAGTIILCWIINTCFLERFYVTKKQEQLVENYNLIENASAADELSSSEFGISFDKMCANGNLTVIVLSADGTPVLSSTSDFSYLRQQYMSILFGLEEQKTEVLRHTDAYTIGKTTDSRLSSEYLTLTGTLSDGNLILMRTALESIRVSVDIANKFLLYVGLVMIVVGALVGTFFSRRITKPILKLTDISASMVDLNFEVKYQERANNEVDILGSHMNELSEKLEHTISELKTANAELQQDIDQKTRIDEMRKEFLSNVSHELKTPLALIQGYAEGLKECINDDEESRDFYCEVIMDEADKMNTMVKKLLTLNQLEFGNDQITMERFDITELIQGILKSSEILMEQNDISVSFPEKEPAFVWADEFKVEEVITNYLSNARNHIDGERHIRIFYTEKENSLRISVFNTGNQIPEEDLEKIWQKFYKVDKAHTREYGGSGIGLSIVKAIMDSFGQQCGAINHEDGVEFWMELETG